MGSNPDPSLAQAAQQPNADPFSAKPAQAPARGGRLLIAVLIGVFAALFFKSGGTVLAAWQEIEQFLSLHGKPAASSAAVLSEHETENLDQMTPQNQARLLLGRSINHFQGANDQIAARVDGWRGKITLDQSLNSLFMTALNSDDLRVRAAAIEIDIASRDLEKTSATMDALEHDARFGEQGPRANALWDVGLLGNRGVQPDRALQILLTSVHDSNENVRHWAVEGLAYLGTNDTITPLLQAFHDDPSPMIRERAACSLAQSGMLNEQQRRSVVPQLLQYADDPALDDQTHKWVFQAMRDITGQSLPHDASAWRSWYNSNDGNWRPVTRDSE